MDVSGASTGQGASAAISKVSSSDKPSKTDVAVAKHAMETEKAQGAQMIDMIQKAGSVIDVTA